MLYKGDMVRVEDPPGSGIPKAIGLCKWGIPDEYTRYGALQNFWIIGGDEGIGMATDFS